MKERRVSIGAYLNFFLVARSLRVPASGGGGAHLAPAAAAVGDAGEESEASLWADLEESIIEVCVIH